MTDSPASRLDIIFIAALIGAFAGILVSLAVIGLTERGWDAAEEAAGWLPIIVLIYGLSTLPFVAFGLLVFGLPIAMIVGRRVTDFNVLPLILLWAALAGHLAMWAVVRGDMPIAEFSAFDPGLWFAIPTALAYRQLLKREWDEIG